MLEAQLMLQTCKLSQLRTAIAVMLHALSLQLQRRRQRSQADSPSITQLTNVTNSINRSGPSTRLCPHKKQQHKHHADMTNSSRRRFQASNSCLAHGLCTLDSVPLSETSTPQNWLFEENPIKVHEPPRPPRPQQVLTIFQNIGCNLQQPAA